MNTISIDLPETALAALGKTGRTQLDPRRRKGLFVLCLGPRCCGRILGGRLQWLGRAPASHAQPGYQWRLGTFHARPGRYVPL